jgi:DHA2 family multidrug resistance protein-like MFS transporter
MTTATSPRSDRATARQWAGLALLALPMLTLAADLTILFFALPDISADLDAGATQTLWITHAYGFLIAGFLLTSGRLGDRIGPRRLLLAGAAAFAALSVAAAYAPNAETLIAARAALGVAGATLMPSLLSLLRTMFRDEAQRRLAIALVFSAFTVGGAVGPLLGGLLLEHFWWGAAFLVNVPPMVLLLAGGTRLLPERTERNRARIDLASVALSVAGILAVVYGLQELAAGQGEARWPHALGVAAGAGILALFALRQRRLRDPLLDLSLLRGRRTAVSLATLLLMGVSMTGVFYLFTQYLQWVGGLSPLRAGLWTLPYIVLNVIGALLMPGLARRLRPAAVVAGGLFTAAAGAALLALATGADAGPPLTAAAITLVGFGQGAAGALVSDLVIAGVPQERTGSAASAQQVGAELGTALGIAAGGTVGVLAYRRFLEAGMPAGVPDGTAAAARESVHGGIAAAEGPAGGADLLNAVRDAVGFGQQVYAGIGAVVLAVAATAVLVLLAGRTERTEP